MQLFYTDIGKILQKKISNLTWTLSVLEKPDDLVFMTSSSGPNLLCFGSLMYFLPFHASNTLELKIPSCYPLSGFCYETTNIGLSGMSNQIIWFSQCCQVWSSTHATDSHAQDLLA
jgi:hypothetical protein